MAIETPFRAVSHDKSKVRRFGSDTEYTNRRLFPHIIGFVAHDMLGRGRLEATAAPTTAVGTGVL